MQHKLYFAALLCGALCLTGCLKNEESDSVVQVRNAKANELNASANEHNAQAELLKAQAAATTTLANAEAALQAAEAKIKEATAAKIAAETAYQEISNAIHELDIQLKQVQVESARVDLEIKKAELEQKLVDLEVAKAQAQETLAEIAAELQAIQAQMEQDAITAATALLEAQQAYAEQAQAMDQAEREYIESIAAKYFLLQQEILQLNIEIAENEATIAALEAGIKDPEAVYNEKIAEYQLYINYYSALYEKCMEYSDNLSEEEYMQRLADVTVALIDAQNVYYNLLDAEQDALEAEQAKLKELHEASVYYRDVNRKNDPKQFYKFAKTWGADDTNSNELVYETQDKEKIVLFTAEKKASYDLIISPDIDEDELKAEGLDPQWYIDQAKKAAEDRWTEHRKDIEKAPFYFAAYQNVVDTLVPASINVENFEVLFKEALAKQKETSNETIKQAESEKATALKDIESQIASLEKELAAMNKYVESVKDKFDAAQADVDQKTKDNEAAQAKVAETLEALKMAQIAGAAELQAAYKAWKDAENAAVEPNNKVTTDGTAVTQAETAIEAYNKAIVTWYTSTSSAYYTSYSKIPADEYAIWIAVHTDATLEEKVKVSMDLVEAAIGKCKADVNTAEEAVPTTVSSEFSGKKTTFEKKKDDYVEAEKLVSTTYDAYFAAYVAYIGDPSNANKTALASANAAYEGAYKDYYGKDLEGNVIEDATLTVNQFTKAQSELKTAEEKYYEYYGVKGDAYISYPNTKVAEDGSITKMKNVLAKLQEDLEKVKGRIQENETALTNAQNTLKTDEEAAKPFNDKVDETKKAYGELADKFDATSENAGDEAKAYAAAQKAASADKPKEGETPGTAYALQQAQEALTTLTNTYKFYDGEVTGYNGKTYAQVKDELDDTKEGVAKALKTKKEDKENTAKTYDDKIDKAKKKVTDLEDLIAHIRADITKDEEEYKAGYEKLIAEYNAAAEEYLLAKVASDLAYFNVGTYESEYAILTATVYMYDQYGNYVPVEGEEWQYDQVVSAGDPIYGTETVTNYDWWGNVESVVETTIIIGYEQTTTGTYTLIYKGLATKYYEYMMQYYTAAAAAMYEQYETNWNYNIAIAKLQLENSQKEDEIAIKTRFAELYAAILNEWFGSNE